MGFPDASRQGRQMVFGSCGPVGNEQIVVLAGILGSQCSVFFPLFFLLITHSLPEKTAAHRSCRLFGWTCGEACGSWSAA